MAEKDGKGGGDTAKEAAAAPKKGRSKLLIIIAAALALLGGGGGAAAYFVLGKKHDVAQVEEEEDAPAEGEQAAKDKPEAKGEKLAPKKVKKKKKSGAPVFVELDMFTANLRDDEGDRFIQVKLVAEVRDAPAGEMLKTMMPAVRNEVLLLLGSKEVKDVSTREGKEKLAGEIVAAANKTLEGTPAANGVEGVNFTHIIVQ
ncbi:MAG TPA: flagellar basal body-associated FliL family protein [Burkholderiaceae bacterium]|nr:flagellar basal body-associated FliL family protein [Burkholderiaceae bacterium]